MKLLMAAAILALFVIACTLPPEPQSRETPLEDVSGVDENVDNFEQDLDEIERLGDELNLSDLEGLEEELDQI